MTEIKKRIIINAVIEILGGLLLIILPSFLTFTEFVKFIIIIIGVLIIVGNLFELLTIGSFNNSNAIIATINIILGFCLIFFSGTTIRIIIGVFLVLLPLIAVLLSNNKKLTLKNNIFKIVVGLSIIIFMPMLGNVADKVVKILLICLGTIIIISAIVYAIYLLANIKSTPSKKTIIDVESEEVK